MRLHFAPLVVISFVLLHQTQLTTAANGYHYDRPTQSLPVVQHSVSNTDGHHFASLPTVAPLPPVPALPPLPTGRPDTHEHFYSVVQVHPPQSQGTASKSIANAYRPPSSAVPQHPQNTYLPPSAQTHQTNYQRPTLPTFASAPPSAPASAPTAFGGFLTQRSAEGGIAPAQSSPFAPTAPAYVPTPSFPSTLSQAPAQPLRIPYGKQAVVHYPEVGEVYNVGDRQVKQYAVIEIIDNDIEQNTRPFLSRPFIDPYRAQVGASGTGAAPTPVGQQFASRSDALVMAQQQLGQQLGVGSGGNDAIALGSGGLGFVRLPNGSVYLGSGSLGYISGQQHSANVQEARTRMEQSTPDALHFGHGALGNPGIGRFRF